MVHEFTIHDSRTREHPAVLRCSSYPECWSETLTESLLVTHSNEVPGLHSNMPLIIRRVRIESPGYDNTKIRSDHSINRRRPNRAAKFVVSHTCHTCVVRTGIVATVVVLPPHSSYAITHPPISTPFGRIWSSSPTMYQKHASMCAANKMHAVVNPSLHGTAQHSTAPHLG